MKDIRHGEHLWTQWEGEGIEGDIIYYTPENVDLDEEIVRRALASAMQRDGVVDSLFEGFLAVSGSEKVEGQMGSIPGERNFIVCDTGGKTEHGEDVEEIFPCTWMVTNL